MNNLLNTYCIGVEFPDDSGAEHLELLQIRSKLVNIQLTEEEKDLLVKADLKLMQNVDLFYKELSRFICVRSKPLSQLSQYMQNYMNR